MSRLRIRSIKPDCWGDESICDLSRDARLLFVVLITFADDDGRFRDLPAQIVGHGYPEDDVMPSEIDEWMNELQAAGVIVRYEAKGKRYATFPKWHAHQRINRRTPSTLPPCPRMKGILIVPPPPGKSAANDTTETHDELTEEAVNTHDDLTPNSSLDRSMECGKEYGENPPNPPLRGGDHDGAEIGDEAPSKPSGGRRRDADEYTAAMATWASQHFPGAVEGAPAAAVAWLKGRTTGPVTAADVRHLAASNDMWAEQLGLTTNEGAAA